METDAGDHSSSPRQTALPYTRYMLNKIIADFVK